MTSVASSPSMRNRSGSCPLRADHGPHQQYKIKASNILHRPKSYQDSKSFQTEKKHRNRRRHYHGRMKYGNLEQTKLDFLNDTRHNEYGYIDTNSQRFIRQATKLTTKENMDSIFVTPSQVAPPWILPIQSSNMLLSPSVWPLKRSVDLEGDIFLGGLHMVHERNDANTCGPIMPQGGVQAVETMLHAIDHVTSDVACALSSSLIPFSRSSLFLLHSVAASLKV